MPGHPQMVIINLLAAQRKYAPSAYSRQRRVPRNTCMKRSPHRSLFLPCWLLVYVFVSQAVIGVSVLCISESGSISIEVGECSCSLGFSDTSSIPADGSATHHCGPCIDITSITDTYISSQGLRHFSLSSILLTHFLAHDESQRLASVTARLAIPSITPSIHPAIRTAVLLI